MDESQPTLIPVPNPDRPAAQPVAAPDGPARLRVPRREQRVWEDTCLDEQLDPGHRVRMVWAFVLKSDTTELDRRVRARQGGPGAPAIDPRLLLALWLWATLDGQGSAREVDRLCREHLAYRWLCGGVGVNYHTLSDFRVGLGDFLDGLLSRMITSLIAAGVVDPTVIHQDGTKVRASAGTGSFRSRRGLEELQRQAREHVQRVKAQDPGLDARARAARERATRERQERIAVALKVMPELEAIKKSRSEKAKKEATPRASSTDADARRMRMADGGTRPAYNLQLATAAQGRAIVGVQVVQSSSDNGQREPMRRQVQSRTGVAVTEHTTDGGYYSKQAVEQDHAAGVACIMPLPTDPDGKPHPLKDGDGPGVRAWHERMSTPEAQAQLKGRFGTAETPNAELKTYRGLDRVLVRGLNKVKAVVLLGAVAYNRLHAAAILT